MAVPVPGSGKLESGLPFSRPEELVKQVREVAYRKGRRSPCLCRYFIETGTRKLPAQDRDLV